MTTERFVFQWEITRSALKEVDGLVLNVGCKEDPAHLKQLDPVRVVNCDRTTEDTDYHMANAAEVLFDCARDRWPYGDGDVALVVLGDILEHLSADEIGSTLSEARRVGQRLCVTVPLDGDDTTCDEYADQFMRGAKHRTIVTEELLRAAVAGSGWTVTRWEQVDYGLWPVGFFIVCE